MTKAALELGMVEEIAEMFDVHPKTISRLLHGALDWRKTDPRLVRRLHHAGWTPPDGKRAVRRYLNAYAEAVRWPPLDNK